MSDSTTLIDQVLEAQQSPHVTLNAALDAAWPSLGFGRRESTSAGLTWGYYGGTIYIAGSPGGLTQIPNGTLTLTASQTNYIELDPASGVVSKNTSGFTGGRVPLYQVVVGTTAPTSWDDVRLASAAVVPGSGTGTVASIDGVGGVETTSGSAITANGSLRATRGIVNTTGTTDTVADGDRAKLLTYSNASAIAVTLPQAGASSQFPSGWFAYFQNRGAGLVTITPTTSTIDGASTLTLRQHEGAMLVSDGTNYFSFRGRLAFEVIQVAISDETTDITTGTAKLTFRMPFAMKLLEVRASLATASSSGTPTFDINESGSSILSTKLSIDANERTSTTAATPAVISDADLADDAEMTVDIDTAGTGAKGAKVTLIGWRV